MSDNSNADVIKLLPDQELFNLLGTEVNDSVEQELKDRGYSEQEIKEGHGNRSDSGDSNVASDASGDLLNNPDDFAVKESTSPENSNPSVVEHVEEQVFPKKKFSKKKLIIIGVIAVAAIIVAFVFLRGYEFNKVESRVVQIAGGITSGKNYFKVDTYPDEYENMDQAVVGLLKGNTQKSALEAIKYANEALGFNGSLYDDMIHTTALMGRQSEENGKYKVTWTYHPDDGLEVTYERK